MQIMSNITFKLMKLFSTYSRKQTSDKLSAAEFPLSADAVIIPQKKAVVNQKDRNRKTYLQIQKTTRYGNWSKQILFEIEYPQIEPGTSPKYTESCQLMNKRLRLQIKTSSFFLLLRNHMSLLLSKFQTSNSIIQKANSSRTGIHNAKFISCSSLLKTKMCDHLLYLIFQLVGFLKAHLTV